MQAKEPLIILLNDLSIRHFSTGRAAKKKRYFPRILQKAITDCWLDHCINPFCIRFFKLNNFCFTNKKHVFMPANKRHAVSYTGYSCFLLPLNCHCVFILVLASLNLLAKRVCVTWWCQCLFQRLLHPSKNSSFGKNTQNMCFPAIILHKSNAPAAICIQDKSVNICFQYLKPVLMQALC